MCFFLWIVFNYALTEMRGVLWASANRTMSGTQLSNWNQLMPQLIDGFGLVGVLLLIIGVVIFVVDALSHPRQEMY